MSKDGMTGMEIITIATTIFQHLESLTDREYARVMDVVNVLRSPEATYPAPAPIGKPGCPGAR